MSDSDSNIGCGCIITIIIVIVICANLCTNNKSGNTSEDDETEVVEDVCQPDYGFGGENVACEEDAVEEEIIDLQYEQYKNNRLNSGSHPYSNELDLSGDDSQICVKTSSGNSDVIAILKHNGYIVRNTYIRAGNSTTFYIPNGTYQIFFYYGIGWNPNKQMAGGMVGGFVSSESFSKDDPQLLEYNILTYELILQQNGNFSARPSNASEVFN